MTINVPLSGQMLILLALIAITFTSTLVSGNHLSTHRLNYNNDEALTLNERFFNDVRSLIKRRLKENEALQILHMDGDSSPVVSNNIIEDATASSSLPYKNNQVPTPVLVENWPITSLSLGQITAVSIDPQGNPVIFHRADRYWDVNTFNESNISYLSSSASQLIPNLQEVETLLTNICDTSSIAEFELKLKGFKLQIVRDLKSENVPLPPVPEPAPAPDIQSTSSIQSDSNGMVKTTSLALFKPEPVSSSSPEGISRFVEKARDEGLAILSSPKVGFFRRCRTIKGKLAPPSCKENQVVKEGQVLCFIDQLSAEIPIESDISGEVVKILRKDGEPVGYGDALIAILPSFPGIKKLQ